MNITLVLAAILPDAATVDGADAAASVDDRFRALLQAHGPALRRVASSYERDLSRCDDLFQDICLALWQALPRFRGDASLRTFAFRIAHNRGLQHGWRAGRQAARVAPLPTDDVLSDPQPNPEARAAARQRRRQLRAAVANLPPVDRQLVTLRLEGLRHAAIAEITGMAENTVAVRLSRARKRLRTTLTAPPEPNES